MSNMAPMERIGYERGILDAADMLDHAGNHLMAFALRKTFLNKDGSRDDDEADIGRWEEPWEKQTEKMR